MYLSARIITNVQSVNSYKEAADVRFRQGNPATLYIQLTDAEQTDVDSHALRYMPASGASMTLTISALNANDVVTKAATQPFANDTSIWSMPITAAEAANLGSGNLTGSLTEGLVVRNFYIKNAIVVDPTNTSFC